MRALEREVLELPPKSRVQLAEKILETVEDYTDPAVEEAWSKEIERRMEEIESGTAVGIPADEVMANARRELHETRRVSSARRK